MSDRFSGGDWANRIMNGIWSRSKHRASLNLGIIASDLQDEGVYKSPLMAKLDSYYENKQYDHLLPFDIDKDGAGQKIPVRCKKPRIKVAFARTLSSIVTSKLIGPTVWPALKVADQPDDEEYFKLIVSESKLKTFLLEPTRRMINTGEVFVRFWIAGGVFKKQWYDAKYCYPVYQENGELEMLTVQYVFCDPTDLDTMGSPKKKWYRLDLGTETEIKFDNPEYEAGKEPTFAIVSQVEHGFGFVQGSYMTTTGEEKGYGLITDVTDFIDELCYSISQSSKAVSYNQDPQLILKNMTETEIDGLVRSSSSGWNLGMKGDGAFLESNMTGVKTAIELRDKVRHNIQDITRIVLLDPEKLVGSAQSAKAMEVLHGPLKDLVDELRMPMGDNIVGLVKKMAAANYMAAQQGMDVPVPIPVGYEIQSLAIVPKWPPIFQQTMEDLQKKVGVAGSAKTQGLIAPKTATSFVAEDFGIEDVDKELVEISEAQAAQAALNPFGGF